MDVRGSARRLLLGPRASRPLSLNATMSGLPDLAESGVNELLEAGETPAVPVSGAALPPDVRNGSAFPLGTRLV